ncbi:MAG: PucC family protein [Caldilineaceae bacterium]
MQTAVANGLVAATLPSRRWLTAHPTTRQWMSVLRLGLFQFGVGLSLAPITGALNRVLIDELRIPAAAVAMLIAMHYFVSPVRAGRLQIGHGAQHGQVAHALCHARRHADLRRSRLRPSP